MANPLAEDTLRGTFGELLVQIKLLQYAVQSVSPHKDSGNDLLATYERQFRFVQVKMTSQDPVQLDMTKLKKRIWDILAIVYIKEADVNAWNDTVVKLDSCLVYLLEYDDVTKGSWQQDDLKQFEMTKERVHACFYPPAVKPTASRRFTKGH